MQIFQSLNTDYRNEIIALYVESFSAGLSQQYIDMYELGKYIDNILCVGSSILAIEEKRLLGSILCCPLELDKSLPDVIRKNFRVDKCVYVAEMMVTEQSRGQGIGKQLFNKLFETVDRSTYTDVFIRVWEENVGAITLYRKMGFIPFTSIEQTKLKADGIETFVMRKIYLHKKID